MIKIHNKIIIILIGLASLSVAFTYAGNLDSPSTATVTLIPVPKEKSGQIISYGTRDDGALQKGVIWQSPRFTDNGNGTVTDNNTGLVWLKNANCFGTQTWTNALSLCRQLASGSYGLTDRSVAGDWRLPNQNELSSLIDFSCFGPALPGGHLFSSFQSSYYWSSTTYASNTICAWIVSLSSGYLYNDIKTNTYYVCPVRGGKEDQSKESRNPAPVDKTGQTVSYGAGDDGALKKGTVWANPRFTDNGNGTVTDNNTGLIWLKNANCFGPQTWIKALSSCNNLKSGSFGLKDGSAAGDWRLPNIKELKSLCDYGWYNPSIPGVHPFSDIQSDNYWSSTTYASSTSYAWYINLYHGGLFDNAKTINCYVWPVRGGK